MTIKHDILAALRNAGEARDAAALVAFVGNGQGAHAITHVLWRLQKQGFVTFRTKKTNHKRQFPVCISITEKGRAFLDGQE